VRVGVCRLPIGNGGNIVVVVHQLRTKEALEQLIRDRVEESSVIEYKSAAALDPNKKDEITKAISAFANAGGGTVVYGLAELAGPNGIKVPGRLDPVDAVKFSKERLDQMIDLIRPLISGIVITPIHIGPSDTDFVYVVDVPQGETAHQSSDLKYYARRNFRAVAMADHEIRDVMNRSSHPKIEAELRIVVSGRPDKESRIAIRLRNTGNIMARHYAAVLRLPMQINGRNIHPDDARIFNEGTPHWLISASNEGKAPLFPGSEKIMSFGFRFPTRMEPDPGRFSRITCRS
jgi:hypothetical protein